MIDSEGTYKYYTDLFGFGTDVVVISGSDNAKVKEGVQKFMDISLLKLQNSFV